MSTQFHSNRVSLGAPRVLFAILLLFIAGLFLVASLSFASGSGDAPKSILGPEAIEANAEASLGVYVDNYQPDASQARQNMIDAGALWTRVVIDWDQVEPTQGAAYDWSYYDTVINDVIQDGFSPSHIIISLQTYPSWSWAPNGHSCGPVHPDYFDDFANFAAAAVDRYFNAHGIIYYELGNEPDNQDPVNYEWLGGCWGNGPDQTANPAYAGGDDYADFMGAAYNPMKNVDPSIVVTMGGLAYDNFWNKNGQFPEDGPIDPDFLDNFLGNGGGNYVDIINFHYFDDWSFRWGTIIGKAQWLQKEFDGPQGPWRPVMVTEFGVASQDPTSGPGNDPHTPNLSPDAQVSPFVTANGDYWSDLSAMLAANSPTASPHTEEYQARYVIKGFTRGMSYQDNNTDYQIIPMLWFQAVDRPDKTGGYYYGLMDSNLTPKPSYNAYNTLATELTGRAFFQNHNFITGDTAAEGYDFSGGGEERWVVWRNEDATVSHDFDVNGNGNALRVVEKDGAETIVVDGSSDDLDGAENGIVRIGLGPSPLILQPLVCNAVSAITDLKSTIPTDVTDVELQWTSVANAENYDIWRDDAEPYFMPDTSTAGGTYYYDTTDSPPYTDDGALSYPPRNQHFYLVTGRNVCLQAGDISNRVGAFQFDLVPGTP